jgi:hypothetical protein
MGPMASTVRGPQAARRPRRRRPQGRVARWARRIGGMLATGALLGVGVLMWSMVAPSKDSRRALVPSAPAATPAPGKPSAKAKARAKAKAKARSGLRAEQLAARTAAVTVLRGLGYLPTREADYDPTHTLRVLVGYRNGDPLGPRRAFFFVGGRYIGNDSTAGSTSLKVGKAADRSVTLAYGVFAPGAKVCCPSSTTTVRFRWDGSALTPVGPIPSGRLATG